MGVSHHAGDELVPAVGRWWHGDGLLGGVVVRVDLHVLRVLGQLIVILLGQVVSPDP